MANFQPTFSHAADELGKIKLFTSVTFTAPGAFKETYRAVTATSEIVALKILDPNKCSLARVDREIEAMTKCSSPYIAQLFEHGQHLASNGINYLFVIEEFLDGGTLANKMANILDGNTVRHYALCLCDALDHLAALDLVHRDIKPDNIMFKVNSEDPILVDFGLVRNLAASSLTMDWLQQGPGTPYYSAPEQLNNDKYLIKWRTDQFSLGIVLGFCLTGRHPFTEPGMTIPDTVAAMAARRKCTQDFTSQMKTLGFPNIIKMVEPWPINRYSTPTELLNSFNP